MPQSRVQRAEQKAEQAVYALVHILPGFHPGDRIDEDLEPQHVKVLLEHGDATVKKPDAKDAAEQAAAADAPEEPAGIPADTSGASSE